MSAARGGRKSRRSVSRMTDMAPRFARETKREMADPSPSLDCSEAASCWRPMFVSRLFRRFRVGHDRHVGAALPTLLEHDLAADLGEQRVVLAHGDIGASEHLRAALTDKDVPGEHDLSTEALDPEPLTRRVATVARGPACLLVSHPDLLAASPRRYP